MSYFTEWESHRMGDWLDSFFLRGKGSIFHDFYCGVERIFERTAGELNGGLPNGPAWHKILLDNMRLAIPGLRPAVVTTDTARLLGTFLDFRHKFRHIYGLGLEFEKLEELDQLYPQVHERFHVDIERFLEFLDTLAENTEKNRP